MMARNYTLDIEIDEGDLEGEWITHPSIYLHYCELFADSVYARDVAKGKMEWIAAKIDLDIRKTWDSIKGRKKYGFDNKPTEGAIKNAITINDEYKTEYRKYLKCVRSVNSLTGIKSAFEHKKAALSNLVSLQITGFHSEPRNKIRDLKKTISQSDRLGHKKDLNDRMKKRKGDTKKLKDKR